MNYADKNKIIILRIMAYKTKRYFKVVTWNKGNSHFNSNSDRFLAIKTELLHQNGNLVILSEAEFNPLDENHIKGEFPNYDLFFKVIPGAIKAKIRVMVKKDTVNIMRLLNIEEDKTACMCFKIKQKTNLSLQPHGKGNRSTQI